jgi:hypothetical protein
VAKKIAYYKQKAVGKLRIISERDERREKKREKEWKAKTREANADRQ